jgi:hypothetical protein
MPDTAIHDDALGEPVVFGAEDLRLCCLGHEPPFTPISAPRDTTSAPLQAICHQQGMLVKWPADDDS